MKNNIIGLIILALLLALTMVSLIKLDGAVINVTGTETETYLNGNDGGFIPVYYVTCNAIRSTDYIEVEWNGNLYSAWIEPESEIQTGDRITCGFAFYEGEAELIDIK